MRATIALGVTLFVSAAASVGAASPPAESSPWDNLPGARAYLDAVAADPGFSGVVLLGRGDDVVFEQAYGFADVEQGVPMRVDDLLRLGSLTKPITASAMLVAVDRGLVSLDAHVCDLLPGCPSTWREVTLRHLLSHTSGIVDHFGDLEAVPVDDTVQELERVLSQLDDDESLDSEPGTEYAYRNFNYVLVGAVLEEVTGVPWEIALRQLVLDPLGLESIRYDDVYAIVRGRVRGYERDETLGLRNIDYDDHAAYAAGGLLASAGDLFRWSRAMMEGRLFDPALVKESLTPYRDNYGLGWQIRQFFGRPVYDHTGGIDGFSSHLAHYPDEGLTIIVLSNVENDPAILRACDLASVLFAWRPDTDPTDPSLTPRQRCGIDP